MALSLGALGMSAAQAPLVEQSIPLSLDTPYARDAADAAADADSNAESDAESDAADESGEAAEEDATPNVMPDRDVPDAEAVAEDETILWETTGMGASVERAMHLLLESPVVWETPPPREIDGGGGGSAEGNPVVWGQAHSMDTQARLRAVEAMLDAVARENQPLSDELLWALADPNESVRRAAAQGIQQLPEEALSQGAVMRLQEYVLSVFASMEAPLITELDKALPYLRRRLAQPMMNLLQSTGETTVRRRAAAYSLGRMGVEEARELLVRGAWAEDEALAWSCAEGLLLLEGRASLQDWLPMLEHPQQGIRYMAVRALGQLGGPEALQALRALLLDDGEVEYNLRAQALQVAATLPKQDAVPLLIAVLEQAPGFRTAAANYLRQITQQEIGDSPEDWRAWYQGG